jgi:hypothetical protein
MSAARCAAFPEVDRGDDRVELAVAERERLGRRRGR